MATAGAHTEELWDISKTQDTMVGRESVMCPIQSNDCREQFTPSPDVGLCQRKMNFFAGFTGCID